MGALAVFESGPFCTAGGGIDIGRFRRAFESVLPWIPRYRQKLDWIPFEGWPVWVDHRRLDLGYHIRHIALPPPGGLTQLRIVRERTEELKRSGASLAIETLMQVAEWLPAPMISLGLGLASDPAKMIVTNVPGPQFPLYTVGSRLLGMYPLVPILPGGGGWG